MTNLIHGGDLYGCTASTLDFSSNLNPCGLPDGVQKALAESIGRWDRYPDPLCRDLTAAIAAKEGVEPQTILCGNGAADLIFRLVQAKRPRRALLTAPAFAEYECALRSVDCEVALHMLHEKDAFALTDTVLKKISPALDMMFLCNPNNPTGQLIDPVLLLRVAKKCFECKVILVVDECFNPFVEHPEEHSLKAHLAEYPNLVLLKAFTKLYAMAGLRLGYLLCADTSLLEASAVCAQPWSVSAPAQIAGIAALAEADYVKTSLAMVAQERIYLTGALKKLSLTIIGSQANYIFFKCNACRDLREQLLPHGVLIRSCGNYRGLDDRFYRVAVKDHASNEQLIGALTRVL